MAIEPRQQLAQSSSIFSTVRRFAFKATVPLALAAFSVAMIATAPAKTDAATSDHMMCNFKAAPRTQLVSIDPNAAAAGITFDEVIASFQPWNDLYMKYHGFPIFAPYYGDWQDADILVTTFGYDRTWVNKSCNPGYVQRGNNHTVIFLGRADAWRNKSMMSHELGHALGFADHGAGDASTGHIGFKPCANYIGVMSYCTSAQSWFLDVQVGGMLFDGELIRDYWLP